MTISNTTTKPENSILSRIETTIKNYHIKDRILLAYSGGKDSYFLCLALKELGIEIVPVILDIGYSIDWSRHMKLLEDQNIPVKVIDRAYMQRLPQWTKENEIACYFSMMKENVRKQLTPCTPCYNAKVLMLQQLAEAEGVTECAFGHHGTDAVTSLLKSYFMYVDRFELLHETFNIVDFKRMVLKNRHFFELEKESFIQSELFKKIEFLIEKEKIGTDEPIRQKCGKLEIVRPMFPIFEIEIKNALCGDKKIFPRAECFISDIRCTGFESPREIIQKNICLDSRTKAENMELLLQLIQKHLDRDGCLKFDARRNRTEVFGASYQKDLQSCEKL